MINTVMKKWGYELWIENNNLYCGKHLHVLPGKWCSVHYHKNKKETFYVINGELKLQYHNKIKENTDLDRLATLWGLECGEITIPKGTSFTIDTMTPHRFTANTNEPCDFIEISTHHEDEDSYRIIESV
jgi:mannose-6-phosphate isomerase-like protein (cupin superfamily)